VRYIRWNPALETGYPAVDEQHRELYALVNDLNAAALVGANDAQIAHILARILRYASTHFATEEALMDLTGYSAADEHRSIHSEFASAAEGLARDYDAGHGKTVLELAAFMQGWLETHIHSEDRPFVVHVRSWFDEHPDVLQ
jgi:hemerythrin-like metal-binding protein